MIGINNRIFIGLLFIFVLTPSITIAQRSYNDKNVVVALREMGHQILLASNDSTSRVLPIEKDKERYKIQFESNFYFLPDSLATIINEVSNDYMLVSEYIVEVEKCDSKQVIYSFKYSSINGLNELTCKLREQPLDCYTIFISFLMDDQSETKILTTDVEEKSNYLNEFLIGLLIFSIVLFLYFYKSKSPERVNKNAINIGGYEFDNVKMTLLYNNNLIELSSKESDLLMLLNSNVNKVVERDKILEKVWGDEGDYVGRTLDVFVSKLRKKLAQDDSIKIANIRGVGYKLIV